MEGQVQKIMMQLNYSHPIVFLNFDVLGNLSVLEIKLSVKKLIPVLVSRTCF